MPISRKRARIMAGAGAAVVVAALGAVTFNANAAEGPGTTTPAAITPPEGSQRLGSAAVVTGVQNYPCADGKYATASVPEATLSGDFGDIHHFKNGPDPSWQSVADGSLITAKKVGEDPREGTIPQLLLKVNTHSGEGVLSAVDFIQRLDTTGGVAPTGDCTDAAAVSYTATYVFWDDPSQ